MPGNHKEKNGQWKNDPSYGALHDWLKSKLIKPKTCSDCNRAIDVDLACISGKYTRDLNDWEWLCRRCHMAKDGRLERLITRNKQYTNTGKSYNKGKNNPMFGRRK